MATFVAPAPPATPTRVHGMCLLHADYHPMAADCWEATVEFYFAHDGLPEQEARDCYQAAVEAAMLDDWIRNYR